MNDALLEEITEEVLRRMQTNRRPTALLIGQVPAQDTGYQYTDHTPYDAVIIGSLNAAQLLHFAQPQVLDALLAGIPVYLNEDGLSYRHYRATANRLLWSKLTEQEKQLRQMGVIPLQNAQLRRVITAGAARELRRRSQKPPASAVITPLARDMLEGLVP